MRDVFVFRKEGFSDQEGELLLNETLFHNANGYLGVRGNFEEKYPEGYPSVRGQYVNGFYNYTDMKQAEKHYGFTERKQTMVNLLDTQTMILSLDGETVDLFHGKVTKFVRSLDMKGGVTERSFCWESPSGKRANIQIIRMTSFVKLPLFTIEYRITPLNFSGKAMMESVHSGDVSNYFNPKDSRVAGEKIVHMKVTDRRTGEAEGESYSLLCSETLRSGLQAASVVLHKVSADCQQEYTIEEKEVKDRISFQVQEQECTTVIKYTVICDSKRYKQTEEAALQQMREAVERPLKYWYEKQKAYLEQFWENAEVEIEGDEELNLSVHYNLYQLLQSVGKDEFCNIGAKGLSGEGYEGHYFWDTEMYIIPFFSLTQPELAKNLLSFRHQILPKARENARVLGHKAGAAYPWRTIDGEECSGYFPSGGAQYHINGDIVYALVQYYLITEDWEFMREKGAEVLLETARMWLDIGNFYRGTFQIHSVTGPDEYTCVVNNNYYTNLTAQHNLIWAVKVYEMLKERGELDTLQEKIGIREEEIQSFSQAAQQMLLLYDEELDINPQDDSFLTKKEWDFENEKREGTGPVMQWNHLFQLYRYQMCKQADTVLAHMIFEDAQKLSTMKHSFDYYEKRTTHDSSLSRCIFGIMASKLGMPEKAYEYFNFSSRLDILNSQHNTKDGIHTANMGGTYMGIVYGFLGLRVKETGYYLNPSIPKQWDSYRLHLQFKGSVLEVCTDHEKCCLKLLSGEPVELYVYGEPYQVESTCRICLKGENE